MPIRKVSLLRVQEPAHSTRRRFLRLGHVPGESAPVIWLEERR
jgi:hypothetical protein